jgi:hypothetical protein
MPLTTQLSDKERSQIWVTLSPKQRLALNDLIQQNMQGTIIGHTFQGHDRWRLIAVNINYGWDAGERSGYKCYCGRPLKYQFELKQLPGMQRKLSLGYACFAKHAGIPQSEAQRIRNGVVEICGSMDYTLYWYRKGRRFEEEQFGPAIESGKLDDAPELKRQVLLFRDADLPVSEEVRNQVRKHKNAARNQAHRQEKAKKRAAKIQSRKDKKMQAESVVLSAAELKKQKYIPLLRAIKNKCYGIAMKLSSRTDSDHIISDASQISALTNYCVAMINQNKYNGFTMHHLEIVSADMERGMYSSDNYENLPRLRKSLQQVVMTIGTTILEQDRKLNTKTSLLVLTALSSAISEVYPTTKEKQSTFTRVIKMKQYISKTRSSLDFSTAKTLLEIGERVLPSSGMTSQDFVTLISLLPYG